MTHFIIWHRDFDLRQFADGKSELHERLGELTDATGYKVYTFDPDTDGLMRGNGKHASVKDRTVETALEMYAKGDFCAVSDPCNPEASFPNFVAVVLGDQIREEFAEWSLERKAS